MSGNKLAEVYAIFNPREPLKGDKLKYYVDRGSGLERVVWEIQSSREPLKIIFPAIRGNGNTTELNKLAENIKRADEIFVVMFVAKDKLDLVSINYVYLLLSVGIEIHNAVSEQVEPDPELEKALGNWSEKVVESIKGEKEELEVGVGFNAILKLLGKMKTETTTREIVRRVVEPRLSDLIELVNGVVAYAEEKLGKKILVIIDDLDKMAPKQAEELFYGYSTVLTGLDCNLIYTMPRALMFSDKYQWIIRFYDNDIKIPNIALFDRDANRNNANWKTMREIVEKRTKEQGLPLQTLISDEALELAIEMSGGVIHDFIRIIRESAVKAYENSRDRIEKEDVDAYVVDLRNDYLRILTGKDFDLLRAVRDKHKKTDADRFRELLFNLAILEYLDPKGELWYNVHPVVKGVLD